MLSNQVLNKIIEDIYKIVGVDCSVWSREGTCLASTCDEYEKIGEQVEKFQETDTQEKLTKKQILCFVMSTLGVFLITGIPDFQNMGRDTIGILFGLSAAVFYATVILLNKFIKNVAGIHRTFLQFLAAIITLIPYVACTGGFHLNTLDTKGWINLLIVGLIHTGITYCLYFSSLKELKHSYSWVIELTIKKKKS